VLEERASGLAGLLVTALLVACGSDEPNGPGGAGPGGSGVGGGAGGDTFCPDPEDPGVHYESDNPNECQSIVLDCTIDQNGFQNSCGCGCIDKGDPNCPTPGDPTITWISMNAARCDPTPPECPLDEVGFSNSCGCGCIAH
jgi:hypothetical protein